MFLELLVLIIGIVLLGVTIFSDSRSFETGFFAVALIAVFFFAASAASSGKMMPPNNETLIVSLERNSDIQGSFILGSGMIDSQPVYYAYAKTDDNGYALIKIENVVLYESDLVQPMYQEITTCKEEFSYLNWDADCTTKRKLLVPNGTIVKEFKG